MPASPQKWLPLVQKAKWETGASIPASPRPATAFRTNSLSSGTSHAGKYRLAEMVSPVQQVPVPSARQARAFSPGIFSPAGG